MNHDVLIAMIAGLPSVALGLLAYRRSLRVDAVAAQAGVSTESRAGTAQIIEGLNALIDNLQEDNAAFRDQVRYLEKARTDMDEKLEAARQQLNRLRHKYGENGDELDRRADGPTEGRRHVDPGRRVDNGRRRSAEDE